MSNFVRIYRNTDAGAPALSNTAGTGNTLLDACLVNGYGSITLDSVVVAGNVATCTKNAHGFTMIGAAGPVIRIEGVTTPAGLNSDYRITIIDATTFTFTTTGISDQTATGTITAKRAPAGFSKVFSGTNKAAYRSDDENGSRLFLRINDAYTSYSRICGYESMTDVDTGTGLFPTAAQISGGGYLYKATGSSMEWMLVSDGRMVYFFCDPTGNQQWVGGFVFGDIDSYQSGDGFAGLIIYSDGPTNTLPLCYLAYAASANLARSYTQSGGSILSARYSHNRSNTLGTAPQAYPAPVGDALHLWPIECWEGVNFVRGRMPGLWNPIHTGCPHGLAVNNIPDLPNRTLLIQMTGGSSNRCAIDLTGPWR